MDKKELKVEIEEIERIFMSAKYLSQDFVYLYKIRNEFPNTYNNFHFFIDRMRFAVTVNLILSLSKLYDRKEKYSFDKLFNKMQVGYKKTELNTLFPEEHFLELIQSFRNTNTASTLTRIKTLRDKFYAHLDRSRPNPVEININSEEINELVNKSEVILQTLNSKYFNTHVDYDLTDAELGYDIFRRVDEWEQYWMKHGFIEHNS